MFQNQSSDGDNEVQETAFVEQGGMNENGEYESLPLEFGEGNQSWARYEGKETIHDISIEDKISKRD